MIKNKGNHILKNILSILLLFVHGLLIAQDIEIKIDNNYVNRFGESADLVGFNPLFKLENNSICNKQSSKIIKKLPSK